jgi:hypothetical protein
VIADENKSIDEYGKQITAEFEAGVVPVWVL